MSLQRGTYGIEYDERQSSPFRKLWLPAERIPMAEGETWDIAWRFDRATRSQFEFQRVADAG